MRESMARLTPQFSANRAVREYTEKFYLPAAHAYNKRACEHGALGKELVAWQEQLKRRFPALRFRDFQVETVDGIHNFRVQVYLDDLEPDAVDVELYAPPVNGTGATYHRLVRGEPLVGAVFNPIANELFTAVRNQGAQLNHKAIRVSEIPTLSKSLLSTGFPAHKRMSNPNIHYYWEFTLRSHGVRRAGSAALDLCCVASGRFDGFWEFGLKSWDSAAGTLIVREAGGMVTDFNGRPYHPGDRELFASNGAIHREMLAIAAEVAAKPSR